MKASSLSALLFLGLSLFPFSAVYADEVTATTVLPPSVEPARENSPPCGDPDAITPADVVLEGLTQAADVYIGYPVVSTTLDALPADVEPWLKSRLGIHNGKSTCSTLCVVTPAGVALQGSFCLQEPNGQSTCRTQVKDTDKRFSEGGFNFASFNDLTVQQQGSAQVLCVGIKNWAHDTARTMTMTIRY